MPRTRYGVVWRGVVAFLVVVACAAGATATAWPAEGQRHRPEARSDEAAGGEAARAPRSGAAWRPLLLVGVDHRHGEGSGPGNTDTMMLVRIDDSSATINTPSIPRDLGVQIPGVGYDKINAAYSNGGESLLIKTLRADVFPDLQVSHVLIVEFSSFSNLINAIGCVYAQVDHRYYNHSEVLLNPTTDYSSIDIQPGYQKMCGGSGSNLGGPNTALAFVRFRHNDSDFVRQARQQDFPALGQAELRQLRRSAQQAERADDRLRQGCADRPSPAYDRWPDRPVQPGGQCRWQRPEVDPCSRTRAARRARPT